jgi:hypothetical protein
MREQECRRQFPYSRQEGLSSLEDRSPVGGALAQHTTPLQSTKRSQDSASTNRSPIAKPALLALKVPRRRKHSIAPAICGLNHFTKTLALGSSRIRVRLQRSSQASAVPPRPAYRTQPEPYGKLRAQAGTNGDSTPVKQSRARGNTKRCAVEGIKEEETTEVRKKSNVFPHKFSC